MACLEPIEVVLGEAEPGPPGPVGPRGPASAFYECAQDDPLAEWVINHNLGYRPAVCIIDTGGNDITASVVHVSLNQCRLTFATPASGRVRCT